MSILDDKWDSFVIDEDVFLGDIRTSEQARNARLALINQIGIIKCQIEDRDLSGDRNLEWRRRAKMALNFKGVAVMKIQELGAQLLKQENRAKSESRDKQLIQLLREIVGEATFLRITDDLNRSDAA